jgi:aminoglycoside phosphotransferase family enzyme/predicted kinase
VNFAVERWLRSGAGDGSCERVIETAISKVFLFRERVVKIRKPVNLGYVDFTSLERRRWAALREVAFNRPMAADIYRGVRSITREGAGFALDGSGPTVEWAVEMRRFDEDCVLSECPERIDAAIAEALGRRLARFHAEAAPGSAGGGGAGLAAVLASNASHLRAFAGLLGGEEAVERLIAASAGALDDDLNDLLDQRMAKGFVRCCHGDLHLGNILLEAGDAVPFDAVEFSGPLREIDVLYDLAFLLMDLDFRGLRVCANRVLNGWIDEAARAFDPSSLRGLAALGLFQSARAAVRAHVNARQGDVFLARRYLAAAQVLLAPCRPLVVAVGGLSGSGKSTFARALSPGLGPAPGAILLRSDEIRKRLWKRAPTDTLPPQAYSPEWSRIVYGEMLATAAPCIEAGRAVVLDAVFLDPDEREAAEAVARRVGSDFVGCWLEAPTEVLRKRLRRRRGDASDADEAVLASQLAKDPGLMTWRRIASGTTDVAIPEMQRREGSACYAMPPKGSAVMVLPAAKV